MKKILKMFWNFVTSRNVAIVLLALVLLMLAVGAFLPNPQLLGMAGAADMKARHPWAYWLGERLNSQEIAGGYVFGFIGVFLIISTTLCSIDRLITRFRVMGKRRFAPPENLEASDLSVSIRDEDVAALQKRISAWLKRGRWRPVDLTDQPTPCIAGVRGEAGFWGSVFFHFILITALIGLVVYYFGAYRAGLTFTEGQSYALEKGTLTNIQREPVWGLRLPKVTMGLMDLHSVYAAGDPWTAVDHVARFRVSRIDTGETWTKEVKINDPLLIDGRKFLLVTGGFSPRVVLRAASGAPVFDNFVALKPREQDGKDEFLVSGGQMRVEAVVHPDFTMKDGRPGTKGLALTNPFLEATLYWGGRVLYDGLIPLGGKAVAGIYTMEFPEVRRWALMELSGEPGIGFFFVVSFLGLAGIAVRMWDADERIYVLFSPGGEGAKTVVNILPFSRHFSGLTREKARELLDHISKGLSTGA